jgi:tetratricopeptide (TPR) repeat protein
VRTEVDRALAIDALYPEGYWQRGSLERKIGAIDDAVRDLKHALELRPNLYQAHAAMAECFEDKNDEVTAIAEWQKALKQDDKPAFWRYRYGRVLFNRSNYSEAVGNLVYAALQAEKESLRPGWIADAEYKAADSLRRTGKRADAIERYKRFVEYAPTTSPDRKDAFAALRELGAPSPEEGR